MDGKFHAIIQTWNNPKAKWKAKQLGSQSNLVVRSEPVGVILLVCKAALLHAKAGLFNLWIKFLGITALRSRRSDAFLVPLLTHHAE